MPDKGELVGGRAASVFMAVIDRMNEIEGAPSYDISASASLKSHRRIASGRRNA